MMRQSVEVGDALVTKRGQGWFLLELDQVMRLKQEWSEAIRFDDLSEWARSAEPKTRGLIARRAALRLVPLAWVCTDRELPSEHLSVMESIVNLLIKAHISPRSHITSAAAYRLFQGKLPYDLTRICVGVEEALAGYGELLKPLSFSGWSKAKVRIDKHTGVSDWVLHDLRRYFSSTMARLGVPLHITENLLDHRTQVTGVAAIYNRYSFLPEMREAIELYERHLREMDQENSFHSFL